MAAAVSSAAVGLPSISTPEQRSSITSLANGSLTAPSAPSYLNTGGSNAAVLKSSASLSPRPSTMGTVSSSDNVSKKDKKSTGSNENNGNSGTADKKKKPVEEKFILNAKGEKVTPREYTLECALEASQKSVEFYKERSETFMKQSEAQTQLLQQQEMDTIEVITYLRLESDKKEEQIRQLHDNIFTIKEKFRKEKLSMTDEFDKKIKELEDSLSEKDAQLKIIQQEFAVIKDFKKKRAQMQKELDSAQSEILELERRNKDMISRMEHKFFEEKIRLQKEANRKISQLATKAHEEAVANLEETTRAVFQENVRMAEALKYHVQEGEMLSKQNASLVDNNRQLADERNIHDVIVREKIVQVKHQTTEIKALEDKIQSLEHALSHVVREFEREREMVGLMARRELEEVRSDAAHLKRVLKKKTKEMKYIRRLAQHVLDQRTDLETFFLDALEYVRSEIIDERNREKKERRDEFNRQLKAAASRKIGAHMYHQDPSASNIESHQKNPQNERHPHDTSLLQQEKVDIKDLKWVQKERILRLLFARMNGMAVPSSKAAMVLAQQGNQQSMDEQQYDHQHGSNEDDEYEYEENEQDRQLRQFETEQGYYTPGGRSASAPSNNSQSDRLHSSTQRSASSKSTNHGPDHISSATNGGGIGPLHEVAEPTNDIENTSAAMSPASRISSGLSSSSPSTRQQQQLQLQSKSAMVNENGASPNWSESSPQPPITLQLPTARLEEGAAMETASVSSSENQE